ncbi:hypothetical protein [Ruegeria sp. HKCCD6157]|uniref:hypothetical protein n=1 Tax=Ruegeria sp. HKCCD6157 TaxID=2690707 RepID=UPI001492B1A4|nr:hypothetical protein [Ruegeria sp. HKCCD6157]NOE25135.1 hypothetical protein [Ruegeria sp. HKCCD6157]
MLIGWSKHQSSESLRQPASYLLDPEVRKPVGSAEVVERRVPVPELLVGHPAVFQSAVFALRFKRKYRVTTLSFHCEDIDVHAFNEGNEAARRQVSAAINLFLEVAFAGIPEPSRPPVLVGTHTHLDRLEINIATPRFVRNSGGSVRSFNPHPPKRGSWFLWDALRDVLNFNFGWRSPNDGTSAQKLRGPDWVEKRLAAAERHGTTFDPAKDPKPFLLQAARLIAAHHAVDAPNPYGKPFPEIVAELGFRIEHRNRFSMRLVHPDDPHPLLVRGRHPLSHGDIAPDPAEALESLQRYWTRRAQQNSKRFSQGTWSEPQPDWASRLEAPEVRIPPCHPDFAGPSSAVPSAGMPLRVKLQVYLSAMAKALGVMMAEARILQYLSAVPVAPFNSLANRLEKLNAEYDQTRLDGGPDGRTVRPAPPGSRPRRGRSELGADQRASFRDRADQGRDGAADRKPGGAAPGAFRFRGHEHPAGKRGGEPAADAVIHRVDLSDLGTSGLSRGRLIGLIVRAARGAFPGKPAALAMDQDGRLKIRIADAMIQICSDGTVKGVGDPERVGALVDALAEYIPIRSGEATAQVSTDQPGP